MRPWWCDCDSGEGYDGRHEASCSGNESAFPRLEAIVRARSAPGEEAEEGQEVSVSQTSRQEHGENPSFAGTMEAAGIEPAPHHSRRILVYRGLPFDDVLGYRLAGIADGEGCFDIRRSNGMKTTKTWSCAFILKMRADDEVFVRNFQERLQIGTVGFQNECRQDGHNRMPSVRWAVQDKSGCRDLVQIFDHYQLWSKKRNDYVVWRQSVMYWNSVGGALARDTDWSPMEKWQRELRDGRRYSLAA